MYILWCIELPKKIWEKNFNNADIDIPSLTHFALLDEIWQKNPQKYADSHTVTTEPYGPKSTAYQKIKLHTHLFGLQMGPQKVILIFSIRSLIDWQ